MDVLFEDAFDPNNKTHVRWLKNLVNYKEGTLFHNPFGIHVAKKDERMYGDVLTKLSRKFINSSVCYKFGELFTYEFGYHMDGEYQKCRLLREIQGFSKGTYFEYALVYPNTIDFYNSVDDTDSVLTVERW